MKYYATFISQPLEIPSWLNTGFFNYLPGSWQASTPEEASVIFIVTGRTEYCFNEQEFDHIARQNKPVVILDYSEGFISPQHQRLSQALDSLNIFAYFKRELRDNYVHTKPYAIYPLDFTHPPYHIPSVVQNRDDYQARPIDILMSWGFSSRSRAELHGLLFHEYSKFGLRPPAITPEDVPFTIQECGRCPLVLLYTPCFRRYPGEVLLDLQSKAKITLSLYGNGAKCFRNAEAGFNSLIAQMEPNRFQWSYPWIDRHNCIALPNQKDSDFLDCRATVDLLEYWIIQNHGALYTLYANSVLNTRNYITDVYVRDYIMPKIKPLCATS